MTRAYTRKEPKEVRLGSFSGPEFSPKDKTDGGQAADVYAETGAFSLSQAYAMRIWDGQSEDVSIPDRVARVVAGLKGQSLDLDIVLPTEAANRYLKDQQ